MQAIIRKDAIGPYTFVGGWVVRPVGGVTRFKEGDKVDSKHAYHVAEIGKDSTCGHGEYLEEWVGYSVTKDEYLQGKDNVAEAKRIIAEQED